MNFIKKTFFLCIISSFFSKITLASNSESFVFRFTRGVSSRFCNAFDVVKNYTENVMAGVTQTVMEVDLRLKLLEMQKFYKDHCDCAQELPEKIRKDLIGFGFERIFENEEYQKLCENYEQDRIHGKIVSETGMLLQTKIEQIRKAALKEKLPLFSLKILNKHKGYIKQIKKMYPKAKLSDDLFGLVSHVFNDMPSNNINAKRPDEMMITLYSHFGSLLASIEPSLAHGSSVEGNQNKMQKLLSILQLLHEMGQLKIWDEQDSSTASFDEFLKKYYLKIDNLYHFNITCEALINFEESKKREKLQNEAERQRLNEADCKRLYDDYDRKVTEDLEELQKLVSGTWEELKNFKDLERQQFLNLKAEQAANDFYKAEKLEHIEGLIKACSVAEFDFYQTQKDCVEQRLKILVRYLEEAEDKQSKALKIKEKGLRNQIKKDYQHDQAGLAVVQTCKNGMWKIFKKYLKESDQIALWWVQKKVKVLSKKNENQVRQSPWLLWQKFAEEKRIQRFEIEEKQRLKEAEVLMQQYLTAYDVVWQDENFYLNKFQKNQAADKSARGLQEKHNNEVRRFCLAAMQKFAEEKRVNRSLLMVQQGQKDDEVSSAATQAAPIEPLAEFLTAEVQTEQPPTVSLRTHNPYVNNQKFPENEEGYDESLPNFWYDQNGTAWDADGNPWVQDGHGNWHLYNVRLSNDEQHFVPSYLDRICQSQVNHLPYRQ